MALRIGPPMAGGPGTAGMMPQIEAASQPAILPEDDLQTAAPVEEPPIEGMMEGSAVEWLQEASDLCKQYQCPEDLSYAIEQALVHLIGISAVGATETPEMPLEPAPPIEGPAEGQQLPLDVEEAPIEP